MRPEPLGGATVLPELARGLRAFGSSRGGAGEAQTHFFAPLLAARREAERAADVTAQLRAFDADALRATWIRWIRETAAARCPADDAECRALAAHLSEEVEPLLRRVAALAHAAAAATAAPARELKEGIGEGDAARRHWVTSVTAVFAEADRTWRRVHPLVEGWQEVRRAWWCRALARVSGQRRSRS